ncbi:MAG: UDP-N-acetylmuramoyl-L-alanine--D-glutamate ligase [bacterium]
MLWVHEMMCPCFEHRFDHRSLRGATVEVIGMARTGQAAVGLLLQQGAKVIAAEQDESKKSDLESQFAGQPVKFLFGPHEPVADLDLVVVSPGVPCTGPFFEWIQRNSIPVLGELELASRFCSRPIVAVTGTNGKTTITSMIGHILKRCGFGGDVAGNIGTPLARLVVEGRATGTEPIVVEVSSFQLETVDLFRPRVAVISNLAPDHLDRHASVQEYYEAKARISINQTMEDDLWIGPGVAEQCYPMTEAAVRRFDIREHDLDGLYDIGGKILYRWGESIELTSPAGWGDRLVHERLNAMAAAGAACSLGAPIPAAFEALQDYVPPRHRLEFIARVKDIQCYNDSKATNVHATQAALRSVPAPIILIAGGRYKGDPLDPLLPLIREKVRHVYLVGEAAQRFADTWRPFAKVSLVRDVREAVQVALAEQEGPATLLLSPACASWDMYKNYEERGDEFAQAVREVSG